MKNIEISTRLLIPLLITTLAGWSFSPEMVVAQDRAPVDESSADDMSGGPDFWVVTGVPEGDVLNVRAGPSASQEQVGALANFDVVRNLGCRVSDQSRWCHIRILGEQPVDGWVNGKYLAESAAPDADVPVMPNTERHASDDPNVPELYMRPTGESEVNWAGGCSVLYDANGSLVVAGSSCTSDQRRKSDTAVEAFRREQGL